MPVPAAYLDVCGRFLLLLAIGSVGVGLKDRQRARTALPLCLDRIIASTSSSAGLAADQTAWRGLLPPFLLAATRTPVVMMKRTATTATAKKSRKGTPDEEEEEEEEE
jgi:hypothetical protein